MNARTPRAVGGLLVASCAVLLACAPQRPGPQRSAETSAAPAETLPVDPGCTTNDDCVIGCFTMGSCCPDLCVCGQAMSASHAEAVAAWVDEHCQETWEANTCPRASCEPSEWVHVAVCAEGTCTSVLARTPTLTTF